MRSEADTKHLADPALWEDRITAYRSFHKDALENYRRFSRWFTGDQAELRQQLQLITKERRIAPLENFVYINTVSMMSELFFRAPRGHVTPLTNFGPGVFSAKLAEIETTLLNDAVDETDLFGEGRKMIMDGLLGPLMIAKVGYSADIVQDDEMMESEREHARSEDMAILSGGRPTVKVTDYHPGHIEQHDATIAAIENRTIPAPDSVLRYLKKHKRFHEDALTDDGRTPLETVRHESVFVERTSPLLFACDPLSSANRRRWAGEWFLRPVVDVRSDRRYDKAVRKTVDAANLDGFGEEAASRAKRALTGSTTTSETEDMALVFEGVDTANGCVVTFAQGCEAMLRKVNYDDQDIRPAGPWITASFAYDPLNDCGFALPRIYEGHQEMSSYLSTVISIVARRSVPQMAAPAGVLTAADIELIRKGIPSGFLPLKGLKPGQKIDELLRQLPTPEAGPFLFTAKSMHDRGNERFSTVGSAKSGGGDFSKTATASDIVNESGNNMSEDRGAVLDNFMTRIMRDWIRLARKRYTQQKVADIVGPKAIDPDGWPQKWATRDIVRDKGVCVISGSSKRKNTAIEAKQLIELLTVGTQIPQVAQSPTVMVELFRRATEAVGVFALDLSEMMDNAKRAQIEGMLGGMGGGEMGPGGPEGPQTPTPQKQKPGRRAKAPSEGTRSAVMQGAKNVGGGRAGRGAK
jgi:hypothetical protein